jgi:hypothetical protein
MVKVSGSYSPWNVSALYPNMEGARRAIDALQNDGVEANSISLSGEGADAAKRMADSQRNTSASDAPILGRVIWRCVLWSIVGAVLGVAIGLAFGLSGLLLPGTSNNVALQVASWAMFLHVGGALWGAYAGISSGSAWELTFQPAGDNGRVFVNVAATNERESARAERVLRSKSALSVSRAGQTLALQGDGTSLDPAR